MLGSRALLIKHKIANVYRPQNNKLFDQIMVNGYQKNGAVMIKNTDTRSIVKALSNSLPIWYAPDQDLGINNSIFAPLFGIQAATASATARLAKNNNTQVMPYSFVRTDQGYKMTFQEPLDNYPSGDPLNDAKRTNQILEKQILKIQNSTSGFIDALRQGQKVKVVFIQIIKIVTNCYYRNSTMK
jgi:KDO2-lipid IV(A) lauroyltransferase